jgi:hypothetical protein
MLCGGGAVFQGCREYRLSAGVPTTPIEVDIRDLERGDAPYTTHVKVGEHVAVYPACVYVYEANFGEELNERTKCSSVYYPAVTKRHPLINGMKSLIKKYRYKAAPEDLKLSNGDDIAVLVKTRKFKSVGAIPQRSEERSSLQGMVINRIHTIDGDERNLLQSSFSDMDLDKVLIVEEGRTPASAAVYLGMLAGGLALIVTGGGILVMMNKKEQVQSETYAHA